MNRNKFIEGSKASEAKYYKYQVGDYLQAGDKNLVVEIVRIYSKFYGVRLLVKKRKKLYRGDAVIRYAFKTLDKLEKFDITGWKIVDGEFDDGQGHINGVMGGFGMDGGPMRFGGYRI